MQIQMQAFGKDGKSLRKKVINDLKNKDYAGLEVQECKNKSRCPGWAKIKQRGKPGVINIEWDNDLCMLTARAITRKIIKKNKPFPLLGIFINYLHERHGNLISAINVQLR